MTFETLGTVKASAAASIESSWMNDDYVFVVENRGSQRVLAYRCEATSLSLVATYNAGADIISVFGTFNYLSDQNMIYVGLETGTILALNFSGSGFTLTDSVVVGGIVYRMFACGQYLYCTTNASKMGALRIAGSKLRDRVSDAVQFTTPRGVFADQNYVYVADITNGLLICTFDGATFTVVATLAAPANDIYDVWANGSNVFVADDQGGLYAYSFDGTTFTALDNAIPSPTPNNTYQRIYGDGEYVYILGKEWIGGPETAGMYIYRFANNELSLSKFLVSQFTAVANQLDGALYASNNKVSHCQADVLEVLQGTPEFTGSFSVIPTAGAAPLAVQFTDEVEIF